MTKILSLAALLTVASASALCAQTPDASNAFSQTNLVASDASYNPTFKVEPNMRDAWGIALRPPGAGGHFWIDCAFSGYSFTYLGDVNGTPLYQDGLTGVQVAQPHFTDHGYSVVTGLVYNAAKDLANQPVEFPVPNFNNTEPDQVIQSTDTTTPGQPAQNDTVPGSPTQLPNTTGASAFIFVTEDGCINCWRSNTATAMTHVPIVIDYSKTGTFPYHANSVFSGCAISVNAGSSPAYATLGGNHLYACDFRNNLIATFDNTWKDVTNSFAFAAPASVTSQTFPNNDILRPFNIMDLNGHLYVTYAVWDDSGDEGQEEVDGAGYGHIAEFNEDGTFVKDFNDQGKLNAPWGVTIAPAGFGKFGGDVLVSNFGDGTIAAFDPNTGNFIDQLRDTSGNPISIEGIWGLVFGNGVSLGDTHTLYFTAGPNSEFDGVFGKLVFSPPADTPVMPSLLLVLMGAVLFLVAVTRWPRQTVS